MIEIYKEKLKDLLNPKTTNDDLKILDDHKNGTTIINNLHKECVDSNESTIKILEKGFKLRNVHELHQVFGVRNAVLPQHRHDCHCLGTFRIKSQKKLQETKNRKPVPLRLWRYASYPEKLSLLIYHQRDSEVIRKRGYTGEHSNESQNNEITGVYSYLLYRSW